MVLTAEQLAEMKRIEVEILKKFIDACQKLNLKYYVIGGTLLGTVRHKGFIPWDDDIDIGMPREDYEVFLEKGAALLPEEYFVQSFRSDPEFPANFAKIRNNNTAFVESSISHLNINHGVFIDIFPLDFYPDDKNKQEKIELKKNLLSIRISTIFRNSNRKMPLKCRMIYPLLCMKYPTYRKAIVAREELYTSVSSGSRIANHSGAWGAKEIVPADWYGVGCAMEFEGITVNCPTEYDKWLRQVYGDYMKLPPEEKRISHHYVDVVDLKKSYREYVK